MGRIRRFVAACILMLLGGPAVFSYAAQVNVPYIAEQAIGKAPNVDVYMTGSQMGKDTQIAGEMEGIHFSVQGGIETFEESGKEMSYIILMDNSASVDEAQFEESKRQLAQFRGLLKKGDEMTLYTVGTNDAGGEKTLVFSRSVSGGSQEDLESDCSKIEDIEYLSGADSKTVLYRSLNQILKEQASPKIRTVVLLITDGEDDSRGKDMDQVSTAQNVREAMVSVYGILLGRKPSKILTTEECEERISYTKNEILAEKNGRGYYCDCSVDVSKESVEKAFETLREIWQKETYVVHFTAPTNQAPGKGMLTLTADHLAVAEAPFNYSDYEEDTDAPEFAGGVEEAGSNSICFLLQDKNGINLADAKEPANYMVQSAAEEDEGRIWAVEAVHAAPQDGKVMVTLTFAEDFYNGDYILYCSNIRDGSQDENAMDAKAGFFIQNGGDMEDAKEEEAGTSYGWMWILLFLFFIGAAGGIAVRRKKAGALQADSEAPEEAPGKKIRLTITDRSGLIKEVEWDLKGSLFVGRSDMCNIYFDDDQLSKQHFAVEVSPMGCFIEDLESTNGTFVNGAKLIGRKMLLDGDTVTAGREKIIFHIPKQDPAEDMDQ